MGRTFQRNLWNRSSRIAGRETSASQWMSGRAENEFGIVVVCGFVEQRRCRTVEVPGKESKEHVAGDPPHPLRLDLDRIDCGLDDGRICHGQERYIHEAHMARATDLYGVADLGALLQVSPAADCDFLHRLVPRDVRRRAGLACILTRPG